MTTERKPGRRPGDPEVTKKRILQAAREVFGEAGFERATIRAIAASAEVDPALVHHHFGSKQDLFASAHELPSSPAQLIEAATAVPREQTAETLVRLYLGVFGAAASPALSLLRAAATNESAARMMREYIGSVLVANADKLCPLPDAKLRVTLLGSHMIGTILALRVLELPELIAIDLDELVPILTPMADRYLNDPNWRDR